MKEYTYPEEFEALWGDLKDKRDGRKATAYKIFLRTKAKYEKEKEKVEHENKFI